MFGPDGRCSSGFVTRRSHARQGQAQIPHGVSHITRSSGNLFEDLGFPPDQARKLQAETDAAILEQIRSRERNAGPHKARKAGAG